MVRTSRRDRTVASGASSPPPGKCTKGKSKIANSKNAGSHPSTEVNSPERMSNQKGSPANDSVECLPIKKTPSPSKTTTPSTDETKRPSLPRQQEECKEREKFHRRIQNQILRLRLRRRVDKIWKLSADVVEGYGKYYQNKYGRPLPVDVIVKIETLFLNRVERCCAELGLSASEEKLWTPDPDLLEEIYLTDSGEESEEHDSDDVVFDSSGSGEDEADNKKVLLFLT